MELKNSQRVYVYMRVSTTKQDYKRQEDNLNDYIARNNIDTEKVVWYKEKITGTKRNREQLDKLLSDVREDDLLIVDSVSRLGRDLLNIQLLLEKLSQKCVTLISLKENVDTTTATGKAFIGMASVFAQLERDLIAERSYEGIQSAKKRGKKLGRKSLTRKEPKKIERALKLYDSNEYSITEIVEMAGVSQGSLYNYINKRKAEEQIRE